MNRDKLDIVLDAFDALHERYYSLGLILDVAYTTLKSLSAEFRKMNADDTSGSLESRVARLEQAFRASNEGHERQ